MQLKKLRIIILLLPLSQVFATVNEGAYLGINGGVSNNIVTFNQGAFSSNSSGSQLYNANVGYNVGLDIGYNFNKYNGLELGYNYLTTTSAQQPDGSKSLSTAATALNLSYIVNLPTLVKDLSVFGRVGVAYDSINQGITSQQTCNCDIGVLGSNAAGASFADILGAGVRYKISLHSTVKVEWVANGLLFPIGLNQNNTNIANWYSQNFNVGYNYHF